ncbi:MAG: hypothetical protein U5K37_01010 [Natrialbaceae archaeon]|nr:hypothetical protein [Natrialbaceae archaeon]
MTGKARTFEPDDGDRIYTSVRPESIATVDGPTRDRWVVDAARQTVDRVSAIAAAAETGLSGDSLVAALESAGVESRMASGAALALEHYGTSAAYLDAVRQLALDAVRVVAEDRNEVRPLELDPAASGDGTVSYASLTGDRSIPEDVTAQPDEGVEAGTSTEDGTGAPEPSTEDGTGAPGTEHRGWNGHTGTEYRGWNGHAGTEYRGWNGHAGTEYRGRSRDGGFHR